MNDVTIRDLPPKLSEALEKEKRRRGQSLNQTVIDLLAHGLGVAPSKKTRNGLSRLAGTWSRDDLEEFESAIAHTEQIDEELWR